VEGPPPDFAGLDASYTWRAPEVDERPSQARSSTSRPSAAPRRPPPEVETPTEQQVYRALQSLAQNSPEARSILNEVQRALDDLRRLERLRRF
jgi:hypothetical protein